MQTLNLPAFEAKLRQEQGKIRIFDAVRKKYVVCTPEEWVRQHVVHYLLNQKAYPRSLFRIESGLTGSVRMQRTDLVVFDRDAKPWLLVECKAPVERMTEDVFRQALVYNRILAAPFVAVTNGLEHYCFQPDDAGQPRFLAGFPDFEK